MEALNAVGLTPLSVLAKRNKPRKNSSLASFPPLKNQNLAISLSRNLQGGLVLLSSVLDSGFAKALTYDEALQQSVTSSSSTDFDPSGVFDSVINFLVENPIVIGGGAVTLAVPLLVAQLLSRPKPWGVESAKIAYTKLADDSNAQLLDIRAQGELRQVGSPDIPGLKKKPVAVVYKGEDKPGFLNKLALKFKEPENTLCSFWTTRFDGNSELVAELVTANGYKAAYAIKDGAKGPRGWMNSALPWILPKKTLSLDISGFTDASGGALGHLFEALSDMQKTSDTASLTLGVAAAAGLGLLAYTEVETILQLLGSAALIQFVSKKFLFAEDRKQTLQQVEELLKTKVAPKELLGDIQQIGKAFLPSTVSSKALPALAEANSVPVDTDVQKSKSFSEVNNAPPEVKAAPEPTPDINSVPKVEVKEESLPGIGRPLSPYPNYLDYKPPSSPIPSQP